MAEHASDFTPGQMDISQHQASFNVFVLLTKWGSLAVAAFVLLLVLWFCTDAGFLGALFPAVVVAALGILVLRDKGDASPAH
jgi:hypothetical protein